MFITISASPTGASSMMDLTISHGKESLRWRVKTSKVTRSISRTMGSSSEGDVEEDMIFKEINLFWATLSQERQDQIFAVYTKIHMAFMRFLEYGRKSPDVSEVITTLRPMVKELFELHPQEEIDYWVRFKSNLIVPACVPDYFSAEAGMAGTADRTYTKEDYRNLLPLAIAVRIAIPIWGEFASTVGDELPSFLRDFMAFKLLDTSNVVRSKAMHRLRVFIENTLPDNRNDTAIVIFGISTEDFIDWVLANTVIVRLSKADLSGVALVVGSTSANAALISYLYNYISQIPSQIENSVGRITDKHKDAGSGDSEQNLSRLEGFKIKQEVSIGDVTVTSYYLKLSVDQVFGLAPMPERSLAHRLSPDPAFLDFVRYSIETSRSLIDERLNPSQVNLAGWVLSKHVSVRAIPYLTKEDIVRMIGFAQAWLWYNGHLELAGIVSAIARPYEGTDVSVADTKLRFEKAQIDELTARYPYLHRTRSRAKNAKLTNPAIKTINNMVESLSQVSWYLTVPKEIVQKLTGRSNDRRYFTPENIRIKLADLILMLDDLNNPLVV